MSLVRNVEKNFLTLITWILKNLAHSITLPFFNLKMLKNLDLYWFVIISQRISAECIIRLVSVNVNQEGIILGFKKFTL